MNIDRIIEERENFIRNSIPLQPSENYLCIKARAALSSDFQTRYSLRLDNFRGLKIDNAYAGASLSELMIEEVTNLASKYFHTQFVDVRPISGHIAAMQVLGNLLKRGEKFLYVGVENGGYDGYQEKFLQTLLGIRGIPLPFDGWVIDFDKLKKLNTDIKAIVLGASIIFEPYDIKKLKEIFPDSLILYDASHVLSLFSTDRFQGDRDLIDVIYGSTHKNFPGPQGGIIFGRREFSDKIMENVIWKYYDNFHLGRIASLGASINFAMETNYAERCLDNTQEFINNALEARLKMKNPPNISKTCMVQLSYSDNAAISKKLETYGLLIDRIGRLGMNEVTALGLSRKDMTELPYIIRDILYGLNPIKKVQSIIQRFVRG